MSENSIPWDQHMEAANASPLKILNYYMAYQDTLVKDASDQNYLPIDYFIQVYQSAIEYYNQKFN